MPICLIQVPYNPHRDPDEQTLRAGLRLIELLAECAGDGKY